MSAGTEAVEGARDLVGDVQRFGLFSAATVVDRYVALVERAITFDPVAPPPADGSRLGDTAVRAVEACLRLLDGAAGLTGDGGAQDPATGAVVLPPARPGQGSAASLWVHNTTTSPSPAVELHATSLVSADGRSIGVDRVSFSPAGLGRVPGRSSIEVRVRVRVPPGQPAGHYQGLLVTSAAPSGPMTLRLEVCDPEGAGP